MRVQTSALAENGATALADERSAPRRLHVLVVDDEKVNCEVVRQALREHYAVTCAYSGSAGLDVLRAEAVDLVLLDIMMPEMSGYDVLEAMRAGGLLNVVPVIVLSAKSSPSAVVKGLQLGASDYLAKPFHREELLCRIGNLLQIKEHERRLREEVEARTAALELAQEALKIKSELLANVSHELRTPLNGILGFAQLAAETRPGDEAELREALDAIYQSASRLLDVVSSLLDLSNLEQAGLRKSSTRCRLAAVLAEVVRPWQTRAAEKGLRLELHPDGVDGEYWFDPDAMRKALDPLLSNAVKFSRRGQVTVAASLDEYADPRSPVLEIRVVDEGIGIDERRVEELFEPFRQGDGSSTREFGGVGLGLSVSRAVARALRGDVLLRANASGGTTAILRVQLVADGPLRSVSEPTENARPTAAAPVS